jgi:hypothetical protein
MASMLAVGVAVLASAASAGSLYQGCDESAGTIFMDGAFNEVDHFVAGYNPNMHKVLVEGNRNGSIMSGIVCQSSNWKRFSSNLRDLDDRVRADGVGLSQSGYGPLPKTMNTVLTGDGGKDVLIGHPGRDNVNAGNAQDTVKTLAGDDIVNTADGVADTINCGAGTDKATVDNIDTRTGCEVVTVAP